MANIHGIRDLRGNQPEQPVGNQGNLSREAELFMVDARDMDPRKVSHCKTLQLILCPYFKFNSFLFIVSVIQIIFYITTIIYSLCIDHKLSPDLSSFLGPCTSTLVTFGAKVLFLFTLVRQKYAIEFKL